MACLQMEAKLVYKTCNEQRTPLYRAAPLLIICIRMGASMASQSNAMGYSTLICRRPLPAHCLCAATFRLLPSLDSWTVRPAKLAEYNLGRMGQ